MDGPLRQEVRERAGDRCEYCGLHQQHDHFHSFHVEHIIARQHGGTDDPQNLALACHHCNLRYHAPSGSLNSQQPRRFQWLLDTVQTGV